jgi:hypothetical protein
MTTALRIALATLLAGVATAALARDHGPLPAGHDDTTYYEETADAPAAEPAAEQTAYDDASMKFTGESLPVARASSAASPEPVGYDESTMEPLRR